MRKPWLLLSLLILFSCEAFQNIQNMTPLEVTSHSPGDSVIPDLADYPAFSLGFNRNPDRTQAESAFKITVNGEDLMGSFSWPDGRTLMFTPFNGFQANQKYEVTLKKNVEDSQGNSLEEDFRFSFGSNDDITRPEILSVVPNNNSTIEDPYSPITITFSESMDLNSFLDNIRLSPSIKGIWSWSANLEVFTYTPLERYGYNEDYTLQVNTSIMDQSRNNIPDRRDFYFRLGGDEEAPTLQALGIQGNQALYSNSPNFLIIQGWNREEYIYLSFSEPMDLASLGTGITLQPSARYTLETLSDQVFYLEWTEPLLWDETYQLDITANCKDLMENPMAQAMTFYIHVNGPTSMPPVLSKVNLYDSATGIQGTLYDRGMADFPDIDMTTYHSGTRESYVDFYLELAQGAEVDYLNFLENLVISPNTGNTVFSLFHMEVLTQGSGAPWRGTLPADIGNCTVARVYCDISYDRDTPTFVSLRLRNDFQDSLGNAMSPPWETMFFIFSPP